MLLLFQAFAWAQPANAPRSQELSEDDGLPVLVKHLPDWQDVRSSTVFTTDKSELQRALGNRPVLERIEFGGGTEAVTASYPAGRLVIVEYPSPQGSVDADNKIHSFLAVTPALGTEYRRVGNYNVFVFDAKDPQAAVSLIEQVKYEKNVQWLGEDPYLFRKFERYFINTTRDIFISTVVWIVTIFGLAIACGLITGYFFFRLREQKRANWTRFTDAGGLTRLNLDELSE